MRGQATVIVRKVPSPQRMQTGRSATGRADQKGGRDEPAEIGLSKRLLRYVETRTTFLAVACVEQFMIFRALASAPFAGCVVLAWLFLTAGAAPAEDANTGPAPNAQTATTSDPTAARVKYLHDRLRITAEQEGLWDKVGHAIHDNALTLAPLLRRRLRATTSGSAPELLHTYEVLGEAQLDSQRKVITAFEPLYASLSEGQRKIADAIIREGAQSATFVPLSQPPFTSSLAFPAVACPAVACPAVVVPPVACPSPWSGPGVLVAPHPAVGIRRFHSVALLAPPSAVYRTQATNRGVGRNVFKAGSAM
jgi:hypothetical protein